ncbi:MAG: asnA [Acidobacteria bacterium]|nr:asnA [Acidobacteriota bacterium]
MPGADGAAHPVGSSMSSYEEVARTLPADYRSALTPMETMEAVFAVKAYIEQHLCEELNLKMVQAPLVVTRESGVNDTLERDGSHTAVEFTCGLGITPPLNAQVVQAVTKWKRLALAQFGCGVGEGICTDMRAVRKDTFLDHDHSVYVDQWDWERVVTAADRNLDFLRPTATWTSCVSSLGRSGR